MGKGQLNGRKPHWFTESEGGSEMEKWLATERKSTYDVR